MKKPVIILIAILLGASACANPHWRRGGRHIVESPVYTHVGPRHTLLYTTILVGATVGTVLAINELAFVSARNMALEQQNEMLITQSQALALPLTAIGTTLPYPGGQIAFKGYFQGTYGVCRILEARQGAILSETALCPNSMNQWQIVVVPLSGVTK